MSADDRCKNKIVSADEAIAIIRDGDTVCVSGFVGIGTPDELILAPGAAIPEGTATLASLTLVFAAAPGRRQGARAQSPRA